MGQPTPRSALPYRRLVLLMGTLAAMAATGCVQRNVERIGSEEAASIPPPPAPQAASRPGANSGAPTTSLAGTVEVADDLTDLLPERSTLYLIVRVAGRETGAPLAVQQIVEPRFPFEFVITEQDSMIEGTPLVGDMSITARVDQDGDAFTTSPGDLRGQTAPVVAGDSGIVVRLDERVSGDDGG